MSVDSVKEEPSAETLRRWSFVEQHTPLVFHLIATRFKGYVKNSCVREELVSIGYLALVKASHHWNPQGTASALTYAYHVIRRDMWQHFNPKEKKRKMKLCRMPDEAETILEDVKERDRLTYHETLEHQLHRLEVIYKRLTPDMRKVLNRLKRGEKRNAASLAVGRRHDFAVRTVFEAKKIAQSLEKELDNV
jgi:RNA polymerase sigma factor (sigma-70 family)